MLRLLPAIAWALLVAVFLLTPPSGLETPDWLEPWVEADLDKPVHFALFLILGLAVAWSGRVPALANFLGVVAYSALLEGVQPWVGRSTEVGDLVANVLGAMVAWLLARRLGRPSHTAS